MQAAADGVAHDACGARGDPIAKGKGKASVDYLMVNASQQGNWQQRQPKQGWACRWHWQSQNEGWHDGLKAGRQGKAGKARQACSGVKGKQARHDVGATRHA